MAKRAVHDWADDILTASQAAQIADLDRAHFGRLIKDGKGPPHQTVKAGTKRLVLILRRDLERWIKGRNA